MVRRLGGTKKKSNKFHRPDVYVYAIPFIKFMLMKYK